MPFLFAAGGIERKQALVSGTQVKGVAHLIGVTSLVISPGSFGCFTSPVRNTQASFRLWTLSALICFRGEKR